MGSVPIGAGMGGSVGGYIGGGNGSPSCGVDFTHPLTIQLGADPRVKFAHIKHQWKMDKRANAFEELRGFVRLLTISIIE